ncbi:MAG TPA: cytochrome c4 [Gammaproteobacteria bacterium]|nr:cytochrome c4 [Gammaproteobacteria bacterium]
MSGYIASPINFWKWLNSLLRFGVVMLIAAGTTTSSAMGVDYGKDTAQKIVAEDCGACHGIHGNSVAPNYPKLAAQIPHYIRGQLHDFASGARTSPIMSGMAKALSDAQIRELAQYFSQQTNKNTAHPDTSLVAQGKKIFHGGVSATNVPACAACHGPAAIGLPPLYPRLAGQNPPYVESQLLAFRSKQRSNDPRAMMRDIAGKLTAQEIKAVAAYLGSLP